jgi:3',5'-cyclic AMP phosphodiesterase CpdA
MLLRPVLGRAASATSSLPQPSDSLRVVFLTDIHARDDVPGIAPFLDNLAARINALQPDLVLSGGDSIEGGYFLTKRNAVARWALFQNFRRQLRAPFYTVPGNHDLDSAFADRPGLIAADPFAMYLRQFQLQRTYGAFDFSGWHFILLNSVDVAPDRSNYRGLVDAAQLAWLRNHLAGVSPQTPIVVLTHIPLQLPLTPFMEAEIGALRSNFFVQNGSDVLAAFAGKDLRLVLQGHLHIDAATTSGTPQFVTGGAVCGEWWQGSSIGTPNGFGLLALSAHDNGWQYFNCPWTPNSTTAAFDPSSAAMAL